jgi:hypothetical protein
MVPVSLKNHRYEHEPQSKLWKPIPQQAAGYYTLRYAGLFNLPIPLRYAFGIGVSTIKLCYIDDYNLEYGDGIFL